MKRPQSAFSLIEVLLALLILSIGIIGAGQSLVESKICARRAEHREKLFAIAGSIADSLTIDPRDTTIIRHSQYWQEKLDKICPDTILSIQRQKLEEQWIYTVTISSPAPNQKAIELKIAV